MSNSPDPGPAEPPAIDPALVSYLKRLVTVLTIVMVVGVLSIVGLLVSRLSALDPSGGVTTDLDPLTLPEKIALPDGLTPIAFTKGTEWYAIVTDDSQILIFDAETGDLRQTIQID